MKPAIPGLSKQPRNLAATGGVLAFMFLFAGIFHKELTPLFAAYIRLFSSPAELWAAMQHVVNGLFFSFIVGTIISLGFGIPLILCGLAIQKVMARLR